MRGCKFADPTFFPSRDLTPEIPNLTFSEYPVHPLSRSDSYSMTDSSRTFSTNLYEKPLSSSLDLAYNRNLYNEQFQQMNAYYEEPVETSRFGPQPGSPCKM